jgi:phage terminase small subunit
MTSLRQKEGGRVARVVATGKAEDIMNLLTEKQLAFCKEYLIDFNGAAAVLRAGYQTKYANRMAYELMDHPAIKFAIRHLADRRQADTAIKPDYVIKKVVKAIEEADRDGKSAIVLKGCELLARHLGMFIERQEISGPNGDPIKYQQVQEAADAFTSAISSLIERGGEGPTPFEIVGGDKS